MRQPESLISRDIRLALSEVGVRTFRNNVGVLKDERGNRVVYGLCKGSSDLIGWTPVEVTPDMVGQTLAVFTAIEVKSASGRVSKEQQRFVDAVSKAGGLAGIARNIEQALLIVNK